MKIDVYMICFGVYIYNIVIERKSMDIYIAMHQYGFNYLSFLCGGNSPS